MNVTREETNKLKKAIECSIIKLVSLGWDRSFAGSPFLVSTQAFIVVTGINWNVKSQALKTWLFSFCHFCSALKAGLSYFWDQRRITQVNHAPRPSGSFVQDVPCSFSQLRVVNYLKTFRIGLVACAMKILVMVRMGQEFTLGIINDL